MSVLVTGGAGFVGSHICKALAHAGYEPVVYDNLSRGREDAVRWGPLVRGDICDTEHLTYTLRRCRADGVIHCAALAYVSESFGACAEYERVNVHGTASLLEAMRRANIKQLVFSSSCAVYGDTGGAPCTEDTPTRPVNPYGASKAACEQLMRMHGLGYGLRWMALRYFNAAGADPDGEIGENHEPETHVIPLAILAALGLASDFVLCGEDFSTPDGSAVRDFVHVSDLADAHVRAHRLLADGGQSASYNLCTGEGFSVLEICEAVSRVLGVTPPIVRAPRRQGDPPVLIGAGDAARAALGWRPVRSSLDEMIADSVAWLIKDRRLAASLPSPLMTSALASPTKSAGAMHGESR